MPLLPFIVIILSFCAVAAMPIASKQRPPSTKKIALRDLPRDNIMPEAQSTPVKRKRPLSEPVNVSGARRHYPDCPPSPCHQSTSCAEAISEVLPKVNDQSTLEELRSPPLDHQAKVSSVPDSSPIPEASPALSFGSPVFSPGSKIYWKDRFLMLQKFLKQCDQADQEEYIQSMNAKTLSLSLSLTHTHTQIPISPRDAHSRAPIFICHHSQ